ncbi:probable membrane-associated kinase regulator 3 [Durio zibethinus]|uniref:Probable membrane-associated kinase regulator 3 n=1 Tax=Durio zibethinus TaxID=66656 RepID=A0A6P5YWX1_DURZI|nr:probable membrane-associated kinase regulator 3 [Durio zibethinus]
MPSLSSPSSPSHKLNISKRERFLTVQKMARSQASCTHAAEDYIVMEVSSSSNFLCYSISSPPQIREFEFQMCSVSRDGETSTFPADELFYKGKLLPLHLPPRLQMVQKLLQSSNSTFESKTEAPFDENSAVPFVTGSAIPSTNTSTPLESSGVSSELNPDDGFFECSTELNVFIGNNSKSSWSTKLKQIKQSSISQKLKVSRAYLKSLFSKTACSDGSCDKAACIVEAENVSKGKDCVNKYMKMAKKNSFGKIDNDRYKISSIMKSIDRELVEDAANSHRRSFSGVIQRHSATKSSSTSTSSSGSSSSSSSFSFSSSGFCDLQSLKRSSSANSEIENSIEGAIAHCKQSQQLSTSRKTYSEPGDCSLSASKISVSREQERPGLC